MLECVSATPRGISREATFFHGKCSITLALGTRAQHRNKSSVASRIKVPGIILRAGWRATILLILIDQRQQLGVLLRDPSRDARAN